MESTKAVLDAEGYGGLETSKVNAVRAASTSATNIEHVAAQRERMRPLETRRDLYINK
jgi:hypothetical protein